MKLNTYSRIPVLRAGLVALFGLGVALAHPASASGATVKWDLGGASDRLDGFGDGTSLQFSATVDGVPYTVRVAAFSTNTTTTVLRPAAVTQVARSGSELPNSNPGGLGVLTYGQGSGHYSGIDNSGHYEFLVFAFEADDWNVSSFHLNETYDSSQPIEVPKGRTDVSWWQGGTLNQLGTASDPFAGFGGKTIAQITQNTSAHPWGAYYHSGSYGDRTLSGKSRTGRYLIVAAELSGNANDDHFFVDQVKMTIGSVGCAPTGDLDFVAPAARTLTANAGSCTASVPNLLAGLSASGGCGAATFTQSPTAGAALTGKGPHVVTVTATDTVGQTVSKPVAITVEDVPVITSCPVLQTVNADAVCSLAMPAIPVTAVDHCSGGLQLTQLPAAGTDLDFGENLVLVTLSDGAGHSVYCQTTVAFTDATAPTIVCPADLGVNTTDDMCVATNVDPGEPVANDNCDPTLLAIAGARLDGAALDGTYPLGATDLAWSATDGGGNTASCAQVVTVSDAQAPAIACPADVTATTDPGSCAAASVDLGAASASDNCDVVTPTNDAPTAFQLGATTVTWTASDLAANQATCPQHVVVADDEAPTMACPADAILVTPAEVCAVTADLGSPTARDNCAGDLQLDNDAVFPFGLGLSTVTWSVTDAAGNSDAAADCAQGVRVLSGAGVGFQPPLKGQPVMNKINTRAQTVPHKVRVTDCAGLPVTTGVIVVLRIAGMYDPEDGGEPFAVEDVLEEDVGRGEVIDGEAIMEHDGDGQYHFNVDTTLFPWPDTTADPAYWYRSTASVYDAATGTLLGETYVDLETAARGK